MVKYWFLGVVLVLASCVQHQGMLLDQNSHRGEKVEYVDIAVGYNKVHYFFGIGGFRQDAFINEVKRTLIANYPLKSNQTLENISVDIKKTHFVLFKRIEIIAVADVLQREINNQISYTKEYEQILHLKNPIQFNYFVINQNVQTIKSKSRIKNYRIVGFEKRKAILLSFSKKNGSINISRKRYNKLFKRENNSEVKNRMKHEVNDSVVREMEKHHTSNTVLNGKIIAVSPKKSLVVFGTDTLIYSNSYLYK
jgi:hypothetical protein